MYSNSKLARELDRERERERKRERLIFSECEVFLCTTQQSVSQSCFTVLPLLSHFIFSLSPFLILFFCSSLSSSTFLAVTRRYVVFKTFYSIFFLRRHHHLGFGSTTKHSVASCISNKSCFHSQCFGLLKSPSSAHHSSSHPIRFVFNFDVQL